MWCVGANTISICASRRYTKLLPEPNRITNKYTRIKCLNETMWMKYGFHTSIVWRTQSQIANWCLLVFVICVRKFDKVQCGIYQQLWFFYVENYWNWPRYGLRCRGLCCHIGTTLVGPAGARSLAAAPAGPTSLCPCGSTNHDSADRMSGQFLFYHENEAIHCQKCSDDDPPGWNVPGWQRHCDESVRRNSVRIIDQYDVTIVSGSCIDDFTIARLFSFETASGTTRNERYSFRLIKVQNTNEQ